MFISDDTMLEILALYETGWEPGEIAEILRIEAHEVQCVLDADAEAFPDMPLRANMALH